MSQEASRLQSIRRRIRRAFTLIELLVVVAIIAILASVAAPSLSNASVPVPQTLVSILEIDMRRASIEAIGRMSSVAVVAGERRDRWWIAPIGPGGSPGTPIDGTTRLFGNGTLGPFAGYRLEIDVDGSGAPTGEFALFTFDTVGGRDGRSIAIGLLEQNATNPIQTWSLEPQRTKFAAGGG